MELLSLRDVLLRSHNCRKSVNRCDSTCPSDACYKFIKTIDELKDNGYWVAGAEADNATDYRNMAADMPLAIVIGSEGQGMSRLKINVISILKFLW